MEKTSVKDDEQNDLPQDRTEELAAALDRLSRHAFESGLYDRNEMPEGGSDTQE